MPIPTNINLSTWKRQTTSPFLNGAYVTTTQPVANGIDTVTGAITKGTDVTIKGKGFGTHGPQLQIFANLNGTVGQPLTTVERGTFDYISSSPPVYEAGGRDGGNCLRAITGNGVTHPFHKIFKRTTEVFRSVAFKYPTGSYFPSPNCATPNTFPSPADSCLKQDWLMLTDNGGAGINDWCLLSHYSGGGTFGIVGNDANYFLAIGGTPAAWWQWDKWLKVDIWLKAHPTNPSTSNGTGYVAVSNTVDTIGTRTYTKTDAPLFDTDQLGAEGYAWDRIKFNDWARGGAPGTVQCQYADVYLATGSYAAARVVLGNASTYSNCTDTAICPVKLWADGRITATIQQGGLNLSANTWLFVILPDNTTIYSKQVVTV